MENCLNEKLGGGKTTEEVLQKWRDASGLVKNPKRRFRFTTNVPKRNEAAPINQKLRVAVLVSKVAFHLLNGAEASSHTVPDEFNTNAFGISADDAGSIVRSRNLENLKLQGGVDGLAAKLKTCTTNGLAFDDKQLTLRQQLFGTNEFVTREQRTFWGFMFKALQDMTLMVLAVCFFVSLMVGLVFVASILLVIFVTAANGYLDKEKKKIFIQVSRNGYRQKLSIHELLPGDIVHLDIGDQVPADGVFVSGFAVSVDESCVTGESERIKVNEENPYLLCGSKVLDGACKMLVVAVGMRTQLGKIINEGGSNRNRATS